MKAELESFKKLEILETASSLPYFKIMILKSLGSYFFLSQIIGYAVSFQDIEMLLAKGKLWGGDLLLGNV